MEVFDRSVPIRTSMPKPRLSPPWFNSRAEVLHFTPFEDRSQINKNNFDAMNNRANLIVRQAKNAFTAKSLAVSLLPHKFWSNARKLGLCDGINSEQLLSNFSPEEHNNHGTSGHSERQQYSSLETSDSNADELEFCFHGVDLECD